MFYRLSCVFLFILFLKTSVFGTKYIDSLKVLVAHEHDSAKIKHLNEIAATYFYANRDDSAALYAKASYELLKDYYNPLQFIISSKIISYNYFNLGEFDSALTLSKKAYDIATEIKDSSHKYSLIRTMSNVYRLKGKNILALNLLFEALSIAERTCDSLQLGRFYSSIGVFYENNNNLEEARKYYLITQNITMNLLDSSFSKQENLLYAYNNLGGLMVKYYKKDYASKLYLDSALFYFNKGLEIVRNFSTKRQLITLLVNISDVYNMKGDYPKAIDFLTDALEGLNTEPNDYLLGCVWINLGDAYRELNNTTASIKYLLKAKTLVEKIKLIELKKEVFLSLSKTYEKENRYLDAFDAYKSYSEIIDSILVFQSAESVSEVFTEFEASQKDAEIQLLTKDAEIQQSEIEKNAVIRNIILFSLIMALVLSYLLYGRYKKNKELNYELDKTNSLIYAKNQLIKENINYAERIQQLILPPLEKVKTHFNDSFVFFAPKEVIGGDIYWFKSNKNKFLIAVVDCTGHGVPGALMSMVAYNILNRSSKTTEVPDAASLLSNVNKNLNKFVARNVDKTNVRDGMDIAICEIDINTLTLNYCGAQNPIYIVRNKQLTEYKAERVSMGDPSFFEHTFSPKVLSLQKGDWIYMFTDGFADQKGGPLHKKFYYQPFKDMLVSLSDKSGVEQKAEITALFNKWKGTNEQLDDVLIVGINI